MTALAATPSQTVGPFFLDCLLRADARRTVLLRAGTPGDRVRIAGRVLDGDGAGVPDAMIEIWQADAAGRYRQLERDQTADAFVGFGRCATDAFGSFGFETLRPGRVAFDATRRQAAHINVAVFARGLLNHLFTRIYFADDPNHETDPVLALVPAARRTTLIAQREASAARYRFDVVLQGDGETVFFDFVRPRAAR